MPPKLFSRRELPISRLGAKICLASPLASYYYCDADYGLNQLKGEVMLESKVKGKYSPDAQTIIMTENEHLEHEAQAALRFLERWGMVMSVPDGEDSAGRAKYKFMEPQELVDRAFSIAHITFDVARSKDLVHKTLPLSELED